MNRRQFMLLLAFTGVMSLVGSFVAVYALHRRPVQAQDGKVGPVTGTKFQLVDDKGTIRADLSLDEDGEVLFTMLDTEGKGRIQLNSGGKSAYMGLLDENGKLRYMVGYDTGGEVKQVHQDGGGRALMTLSTGGSAESFLHMIDNGGKQELSLAAHGKQAAVQMKAGDGLFLSAILDDGRPVFAMNKAEKLRMRAMLKEDGEPEFMFLNEAREAVWKAGK